MEGANETMENSSRVKNLIGIKRKIRIMLKQSLYGCK